MSRPDRSERRILRLPLELLQDILACLADPRSLVCAIQASRALYYSFKGNEQHILTAIMTNCIGAGVLREAQLTRDCTPPVLNPRVAGYPVDPHKKVGGELEEEQRKYLAAFLLRDWPHAGGSVRKSWAISDALALGNYHTEVILPLKDRIIKAASDPANNGVARHDAVWGNFRVGFDAKVDNSTIQHLLTLGLEEILAIIRLQDSLYEACRQALSPEEEAPYVSDEFLWFELVIL